MNFKALKMDGLGNDFLIIDNRNQSIKLSACVNELKCGVFQRDFTPGCTG